MNALQKVMKEKFAESEFLVSVPEKLGGAICMHYDESSGQGEFLWTHTTSSMGIGFQVVTVFINFSCVHVWLGHVITYHLLWNSCTIDSSVQVQ